MKIEVRAGSMRMQRIGTLSPVRQRAMRFDVERGGLTKAGGIHPRAPERRGIWAFPWPYFDPFFASYQRHMAIPARFDKAHAALDERDDLSLDDLYRLGDEIEEERRRWMRTEAGRRALRESE